MQELDRLEFDLALLDVNLDGVLSTPVAEALDARGVPFLFITGYGRAGVPEQFQDRIALQKPFRLAELRRELDRLPIPARRPS